MSIQPRRLLAGFLLWVIWFACCWFGFRNCAALDRVYPAVSLRYKTAFPSSRAKEARQYAVDNAAGNQEASGFWPTFWAVRTVSVQGELAKTECECLYFSGEASLTGPVQFLAGGYPGEVDDAGCSVSSALAWQLWGSMDVVGKPVKIGNNWYFVRGVFADDAAPRILVSTADKVNPFGWQGVELEGNPEGDRQAAALEFAVASGLGAPDTLLDGPALSGLAGALVWVPVVCMLGFGFAACVLFFARGNRGKSGKREIIWFLLLGGFALALPWLLSLLPPALIPTRWSDFSFWAGLKDTFISQLKSYLSMQPYARDVDAKLLLLSQLTLFFGASFSGILLCWRNFYCVFKKRPL